MKFGMFYPVAVASEADLGKGLWGLDRDLYATTIEELREQAIVADETGWTSMMFAEHHFEIEGYHVTPNPLLRATHQEAAARPDGSGAAELESAAARRGYRDGRSPD